MTFQKIVLVIATVLLIIILIVIGVTLSNAYSDAQWPPVVGECPDYWVDTGEKGNACLNTHRLGKYQLLKIK